MINDNTSPGWGHVQVSSGRRRRWSVAEKGRIVAESFERGISASDVARRHDISPQQLFQWRRQARRGSFVVPVDEGFSFAEVEIAPPAPVGSAFRSTTEGLEITVGAVAIKVGPASDLGLLSRVIRLLRSEAA